MEFEETNSEENCVRENHEQNSSWQIYLFAVICVLFSIMRIIKFIPTMPNTIYYAGWGILAIFILFHKKNRINFLMLLFLILCLLSIISNVIDPKYNVWLRFLGFIMIAGSIGPLFDGCWLYKMRQSCSSIIYICLVATTIISFLLYCIYPQLMLTKRGHLYGGITIHSMLLGVISGLSAIYLCFIILHSSCVNILKRILLYCCFFISILSCLLTGSRSALMGTFFSLLLFVWLYYQKDILKFVKIFVVSIGIVAISAPVWWKYTETVQKKIEYSQKRGDAFVTRRGVWKIRLREFLENPVFGCGFATTIYGISSSDGFVEPGNGWLFVLSSTGVITFILFVFIYLRLIANLYKIKTPESFLLIASLVFYGIHINAEGYILSSGIFTFFLFWASLGYAFSYVNHNKSICNI